MSLSNPYTSYRQTQTHTASQLRLIVMLHDGAIKFLQQAKTHIAAKDYYNQAQAFNKAGAIVAHLLASVKPETGEIAVNLQRIYLYVQERLTKANVDDDPAIVDELIVHLRSIRDAWDQVDRNNQNSQHAPSVAVQEETRTSWSMAA